MKPTPSPSIEETLRIYNAKRSAKDAAIEATREANALRFQCSQCQAPCRGRYYVGSRVLCDECHDRRFDSQTPRPK